jgi:hypothetical protein
MRLAALIAALSIAVPAAAQQYTPVDVANGGSIKGKISYNGRPPTPKKLTIPKDPKVCGTTRDEDIFVVGPDGGVKNVVVYLTDITKGKKMEGNMQPVLDQKGCHYVPHVQVVPVHATLQVKSSDPILHNVHSFLNGSTVINFAMPPQPGLVLTKKLDKAGGQQLKCDVHSFMTGAVFVAANPYYALTGDDGTFEIKDVPPGSYTISTWHQVAGAVVQPITVAAGAAADFNAKIR